MGSQKESGGKDACAEATVSRQARGILLDSPDSQCEQAQTVAEEVKQEQRQRKPASTEKEARKLRKAGEGG